MNNSKNTTGGGGTNVGIVFAFHINTAKEVLPQLKRSGRVARAYIGITGLTVDRSLERLNLGTDSGVLVQRVEPGSPASRAGIRGGDAAATLDGSPIALGGDIIKEIDGRRVGSMEDVLAVVNRRQPGDTIRVELLRDGQRRTVTVRLGQRPEREPTR